MNFQELTRIFTTHVSADSILFTKSEKQRNRWCQMPYPGHPKGCPNFGRSPTCPPQVGMRPDILVTYDIFILTYAIFDFKNYQQQRWEETQDNREYWNENRIKCNLYWQSSVKKLMKKFIQRKFCSKSNIKYPKFGELFGAGSGFWNRPSLEAVGINVFSTLKKNNICYEIKPMTTITMVALICFKRDDKLTKLLIGDSTE